MVAAVQREDLERRQLTPRALPRVRVTCPLSRVFPIYTHGPDVEFLLIIFIRKGAVPLCVAP